MMGMMQKTNQAKHVIHAYLKDTPASGYRECSLCDNRTPYVSNVDVVTLATVSCYQTNHHHYHNNNNNNNTNGKERLLMYMVNK
jgi:hypothetical protein